MLEQGYLYLDLLKPIAELDGNNAIVSASSTPPVPTCPDFMIKGGVTTGSSRSPKLVVDIATNTVMQQLDYDV